MPMTKENVRKLSQRKCTGGTNIKIRNVSKVQEKTFNKRITMKRTSTKRPEQLQSQKVYTISSKFRYRVSHY